MNIATIVGLRLEALRSLSRWQRVALAIEILDTIEVERGIAQQLLSTAKAGLRHLRDHFD